MHEVYVCMNMHCIYVYLFLKLCNSASISLSLIFSMVYWHLVVEQLIGVFDFGTLSLLSRYNVLIQDLK